MDRLWAPWRMRYILEEDQPQGCIFCLAKDGAGADGLVLGVGDLSLVMMNKYPYNNGHVLVAPVRHVGELSDLSKEEQGDLLATVDFTIQAIRKEMKPDGLNVGLNLGRSAGAGIEDHLHFHIVPRWHGDVNFMTVFGEVRVIPEHIKATYQKLKPHFSGLNRSKGEP
ncbi:MAG: HIT domain-containing protein [Desulfarculaceae bacterium]